MNPFPKKPSMVEETQYGCQYEMPQLSSKYYLSPPHSSPRAGDGPSSIKARLATTSPTRPSLSQQHSKFRARNVPPPVGFEMEVKKRAKRRAVFSVDVPVAVLLGDDDSLDEDYAPTQWTPPPPPASSAAGVEKKKKRRGARRKGASPELGVTNMAITDFFKILKPKNPAMGNCDETPTSKSKISLPTPESNSKPSEATIASEADLLKTPSKPRVPQSPFKTPQNRKVKEIPSSTPGLSPLSKALGWVCEEVSPTPKANMRKAMRSRRPKCRRSPLLVPGSQWDENLDKLDLPEDWNCAFGTNEELQAVRSFGERRTASESLASNDEDEFLSSSQITASCRSNMSTQDSVLLQQKPAASLSDTQDSTASCMLTAPGTQPATPVVFPCGQGDPFRTQPRRGQVSTTSVTTTTTTTATTTTNRADEDDHNNDWDRTRQDMDYLMGSSCDEIDDREDGSEVQQQHLQPWNSPGKSSPLGKRDLKAMVAGASVSGSAVGLRMASIASSKADSFCSDVDADVESDARFSFPATQQRPLSRSVSITEDYEAKCVDHLAVDLAVKPGSRPLTRHSLAELEIAESESQCETQESEYDDDDADDDDDVFHDSRSVLSDLDPIATQSTNRQLTTTLTHSAPSQADFTSTPSKPHSHFKTPTISKLDHPASTSAGTNPQPSATQSSLTSTMPSTQFYMDKILTESMLESLPLPSNAEFEASSPTVNRTRLLSVSFSPQQQRQRLSGVNEYSLTQSQTQTQTQTQRGRSQRRKS